MGLRRRRGLSRAAPSGQALVILLLIGANRTNRVDAVVPTASLRVSSGETAYAAPAWFGPQPLDQEDAIYMPLRVPSGEFDGCKDVSVDDQPTAGFALLVERGHCFFDVKALAAQTAGARGIVVMNSLRGIYQVCTYSIAMLTLLRRICFGHAIVRISYYIPGTLYGHTR